MLAFRRYSDGSPASTSKLRGAQAVRELRQGALPFSFQLHTQPESCSSPVDQDAASITDVGMEASSCKQERLGFFQEAVTSYKTCLEEIRSQ